MAQIKLNAVPFSQLNDATIADTTKVDMASVKRHLAALTWLSQNIGHTMDKTDLRDALVVADTIGYPNQKLESHKVWASHVMSAWKKLGVIESVDA